MLLPQHAFDHAFGVLLLCSVAFLGPGESMPAVVGVTALLVPVPMMVLSWFVLQARLPAPVMVLALVLSMLALAPGLATLISAPMCLLLLLPACLSPVLLPVLVRLLLLLPVLAHLLSSQPPLTGRMVLGRLSPDNPRPIGAILAVELR
jgi:hypothetical protein